MNHERTFYHGKYHDLEPQHYEQALDGAEVYFKAFDWASGDPVWMQLCHRSQFCQTSRPVYGFDDKGFFVRPVPVLLWPQP